MGFFEHIAEYYRLYGALLGRNGGPWFAARMRASPTEMTTEHLGAGEPEPTLLGAMFAQAITWWLEHDRPMPAREIAVRTAGLASAVVAEAGRWPGTKP